MNTALVVNDSPNFFASSPVGIAAFSKGSSWTKPSTDQKGRALLASTTLHENAPEGPVMMLSEAQAFRPTGQSVRVEYGELVIGLNLAMLGVGQRDALVKELPRV